MLLLKESNLLYLTSMLESHRGLDLDPFLFIIYINDIVEGLESEILIFADDCSLLASGTDPAETAQQLN